MDTKTYSVCDLAKLSGVSARTLHYYDQIELLQPQRADNNYRSYGEAELDRLQQILLYRRLGVKLKEIKDILDAEAFDAGRALEMHLEKLEEQQLQTQQLIKNVKKTIAHLKGGTPMKDKEKFEGFKQKLISDNEEKYGAEIREKYGDDTIDASNAKLAGMTPEQWQRSQDLDRAFKEKLSAAMQTEEGPTSSLAQEACELHKEWLCLFWQDGHYSPEAHLGLAEMYLADERFSEYLGIEAGTFFRDALAYRAQAQ